MIDSMMTYQCLRYNTQWFLTKYNFTRIENKILSKMLYGLSNVGYVLVLDKKYCKQFNEILWWLY